ncbi:acyl-CoA dehydrogenase family protein [Nocardia sp. alder85J]|uniref:acyl-CoA dehydrogenase family protein n=1 Tax=Nocardia sp. alder85J TaxID=2862949 RepID=UPI001CD4556C|nr:acyl-CoA dehydrogenase family protein [Nocardia sp. alder85J]MCX4099193.1 acyl-CoA/acyl-ACP dehydrogenase [Nocardia sp. alder85J]
MTTTASSRAEFFELPLGTAELAERARQAAAGLADRAVEVRRHLIDHAEMHPELREVFRRNGWSALGVPEPTGAGNLLGLAVVLEAFAAEGMVLWLPVLSAAVAHALSQAGPEGAREHWLPRVAAGSAQLGMAATESHSGHNLFGVRTAIRYDGEHFVVDGVKRITSALDVVDRVLVFGRDGSGYTCVLLDPRAPGASATEIPMGFREGVRQFQLDLDRVVVPAEALAGERGRGLAVMWPFTHVERALTAALCLGTAAYALLRATDRARRRSIAADRPIGVHQAVAHPLAALHARLAAARLLVYRTAARIDARADQRTVTADINAAKVLAADLAFDAADHAMQVLGADAWDERTGWRDVFLDARLSRSGPISNEFALNHLAQHVLGLPAD